MDPIITILQKLTNNWQAIGAAIGGLMAILIAIKTIIDIFKPKVK